jgi:hypothetical protein
MAPQTSAAGKLHLPDSRHEAGGMGFGYGGLCSLLLIDSGGNFTKWQKVKYDPVATSRSWNFRLGGPRRGKSDERRGCGGQNAAPPNLFTLVHVKEGLEEALHEHVDIVHYRERMNSLLKRRIDQEAVYV